MLGKHLEIRNLMLSSKQNLKALVRKTEACIEQSDIKDILLPIWEIIEWHEYDNPDLGVELNQNNRPIIRLYSGLCNNPNFAAEILHEFGLFILARSGKEGQAIWAKKFVLPTKEQIKQAQDKIKDVELRKQYKDYAELMVTYPNQGKSVDRLVFINIINALMANGLTYADSMGLDLKVWGSTAEYCNRRKCHSLIPLSSAYAPAKIHRDYGYALAELLLNNLKSVRDKSVAEALRSIIVVIAKLTSL